MVDTKESVPGTQEQLTLFKDNEPLTEEVPVLDAMSMHDIIANPYPKQTPSAILQRNFLVDEFDWTPTFTTRNFDFPYLLLQKPSIRAALVSFLYFRAGVRLEIRLNSTQYHCGALMLTWVPCYSGPDFPLYASSANKPLTISAATQQAISIDIPYMHPMTWMRWVTAVRTHIARVWLTALHPLIQTAPDASVNVGVQVYASFTDPSVAGYVPIAETEREKKASAPIKYAKSQAKIVSQADYTKSRVDPESQDKNENGVDKKSSRILSIRPILRAIPLIGGVIDPICDGIKLFAKLLDKPTSQETMKPVSLNPLPDFCGGTGMDYSNPLSLYRHAQLPNLPTLFGGETTAMTMAQLAAVPMLHAQNRFSTSNSTFTVIAKPLFYINAERQPDYLAAVAMAHQFWRGTIKYFIQFFTTPFTSCRFRISVNYVGWISSVTTSGDVVSQVIDVKGDTEAELAVPYLWDTHWRSVFDTDGFPRIVIERISNIIGQSVTSDSVIYCSVWRAGSSDMQFMKLQNVPNPPAVEEIVEKQREEIYATSQSSIRDRFKRSFAPALEGCSSTHETGLVSAEESHCVNDAIKRFVTQGGSTHTPTAINWYEPFTWFNSMFYFWRGSIRYRGFYSSASVFTAVTMNGQRSVGSIYETGNGASLSLPAVWPIMQYEVPWYSALPFYPIYYSVFCSDVSRYYPASYVNQGSGFTAHFCAAGDDFMCGYLLPPPAFTILEEKSKAFEKNEQIYTVMVMDKPIAPHDLRTDRYTKSEKVMS